MSRCPQCQTEGQTIGATTLDAQVVPDRLSRLAQHDGWSLCTSGRCDAVYFRGGQVVTAGETRAVPFHKSNAPDRLVCFCFEHSVAEIEADVAKNGTSRIQASIKAGCKAGRNDCERKNPQGRCCLGNVAQVVKRTTPGGTARGDTEASAVNAGSCCPPRATGSSRPSSSKDSAERSGILASGGALVAAVLSSACCWLPLVAVGLGASSAGVGAFFATWRVPLLLATVALLGAGFYLAYRKPRCVPGEACEAPSPRLRRFHRGMLWLMAVFAVAVASFPEYVGAFSQGGNATGVAPGQASAHYRIEGMSCAGCEGHASEAIRTIPGVVAVTVSYRDRSAKVVWSGEANDTAVADALSELGYRSTRIR